MHLVCSDKKKILLTVSSVLLSAFALLGIIYTGSPEISQLSPSLKTVLPYSTGFLLASAIILQLISMYAANNKSVAAQLLNSEKMSSLGEMAADIIHEINTPLGLNQLLLDRALNELNKDNFDKDRMIKIINKIENSSNRITKIIKGLKSFSRDDTNDPMLCEDLREIIEDSVSLYQHKLYYKGIKLVIAPMPDEVLIECRKPSLSQVIFNFLNNSFDAIELNLGPRWIKLDIELSAETVKLLFTDSGTGIKPEIAKKIFQPFYTTKPAGKGTGLGLSVSAAIIKSHHGSIQLDSTCANTRFIIELPLSQSLSDQNSIKKIAA